jgi:uncharacterized PurR-regulated membrane protein YhhQ (DUF165 family)
MGQTAISGDIEDAGFFSVTRDETGTGMARTRVGVAAHETYMPIRKKESRFVAGFKTLLRLIVPVALLVASLGLAYVGSAFPVTELDRFVPAAFAPSGWLTLGHIALALPFFAVSIANRRYGLGLATGQILVSYLVIAAVVAVSKFSPIPRFYILPEISWSVLPPFRTLSAFVGALLLAQLFSALVFDRTRGVIWWQAPLYAGLWGAVIFAGTFYSAAFYGTQEPWLNKMIIHLGVLSAGAFLLVLPYWMMRPVVRPLPGFGGA